MKENYIDKTQNLEGELLAPSPITTGGKFEISDGLLWFTLATENWTRNTIGAVPPCNYGTVGTNLSETYSNGAAGVGATLTNSSTQAVFTLDDATPALNSRILVKDQTVALQNGIYIVTDTGSVSTNWILTRAIDFDSASQVIQGNTIKIISGAVNAISDWMITSIVATVGTDTFSFALLAKNAVNSIVGTANQILVTVANNVATLSFVPNVILPGTEAITIPVGTTAQRPVTPTPGMLRFNISL